ncbi:homoserine kinase [Flavobacteriaceae bacterium]|jgi:homoserine kinase|nr:homoserine kinase [Flavobacteriaceae bacterium]MDA7724200.1 homoserine kinase [Flavobacteriaceae bacterium]MDA7728065.1 homoserine kinase [Flavobacteriaceae bacterium]MDA7849217.1 homoserine kinase [Flavobacteriaceae bacterium]MDG1374842.1 homoserine kinase [Flavobacteriaceae bacterium]
MNEIKLFSPATVANVSCGFDVLGFCLDSIGDEMVIRKTEEKGVRITKIEGYDLPFEVEKNVAGVSALAMYKAAKPDCGFEIEIYKHIKPGSGVGSSSASAVGSVYGMNVLLGNPYSKTELTAFAMKGEAVASQSEHADNIAPALFGGFTLVKSLDPLEILQIPTPSDLFAVVIHPQIEIKTADARKILPETIALKNAITQWSNVGSLIHGLHTNDYDLISRSLEDVVVEPFRSQLIPGFETIKKAALGNGALGTGISGSGPSVFSLCKTEATAIKVEKAIRQTYKNQNIPFEIYVSKINLEGIKHLN